MLKNAIVEAFGLLASWFIVWFVVACLVRALAPDPTTQLAGPLSDEATRQRFAVEFGLNRPLVVESVSRAFRMLEGDWGVSWRTRLPVTEVVTGPSTLTVGLAFVSTMVSLAFTLLLIVAKVSNPHLRPCAPEWFNSSTFFLFLAAIPAFVLGLWLTHSAIPDVLGLPRQGFRSAGVPLWRTLVLPSVCLAIPGLGFALPRLLAAKAEIIRSAWYRSAVAVGRPRRQILIQQGWPFLAAALGDVAAQVLITSVIGAVAVEYVFSLPGLGTILVDAVQLGDVPVILGVVAITTLLTFVALGIRAAFAMALPSPLRPAAVFFTLKSSPR